ncbi:DUF2281 domain-containing protein [bacterium]|nr:DUF2281 domain-containing protein [bacterium]
MKDKEIETKLQELPDELKEEVFNYIEVLIKSYKLKKSKQGKLKFDWEGGLSELKGEYTSIELQHKALGWR